MFRTVSSSIWSAAASGRIDLRKESRGYGTWHVWGCSVFRILCMPKARVFRRAGRGKSASPVRRGESGSRLPRHPLSYSTGSVARRKCARGATGRKSAQGSGGKEVRTGSGGKGGGKGRGGEAG